MTIQEAKEYAETNIIKHRKTIKRLKSLRRMCTILFVFQSGVVATQIVLNDIKALSIFALIALPCSALFNTYVTDNHYKVLNDLLELREDIRKCEIDML